MRILYRTICKSGLSFLLQGTPHKDKSVGWVREVNIAGRGEAYALGSLCYIINCVSKDYSILILYELLPFEDGVLLCTLNSMAR